ncbi:hypothetical protein BYT27DRAFT_7208705 [Phlegmacium glaucopus]|nr:hypothetical protein BYT27DRAFT_7208705 [Phlegmacium glaucopus]
MLQSVHDAESSMCSLSRIFYFGFVFLDRSSESMPAKPSSKVTSSPAKKINALSKASSSPSKKIISMIKTETPDIDLQALVNEQLATDHSSGEMLDSPATPVKKRIRTTPPPPGSDAFKLLDAVSTSCDLDDAMSGFNNTAPKVGFGSVIIDDDARPKRVIVKTEKAKAIDADSKLTARRPLKPAVVLSRAAAKTSSSATAKAPVSVEPAPVGAGSPPYVEVDDVVPELSDDLPDMAQVFSDIMRMKREGKSKAPPVSVESEQKPALLAEPLDIEAWSDSGVSQAELAVVVESTVTKSAVSEPATVAANTSAGSDVQSLKSSVQDGDIDETSNVMLPSCQDPLLAPTYKTLPKIPRLCEVLSFNPCIESLRTPFGATCANMTKEEVRAFLRALLFVRSGQYVNTARIDPALLIVENSRLRIRDKKGLAICIMTGTLTESFVIDSCMLSELGFGFATRGEGKGDGWKNASAPSSPTKNRSSSSVLKAVSSPLIVRSTDSSLYGASRSFDDRIPVYDGRARNGHAPFTFTDADFANLLSWPLYRKGANDIPLDSVVSVGYTLSSYKGASGPVLSSNIHFVIVISTPILA